MNEDAYVIQAFVGEREFLFSSNQILAVDNSKELKELATGLGDDPKLIFPITYVAQVAYHDGQKLEGSFDPPFA